MRPGALTLTATLHATCTALPGSLQRHTFRKRERLCSPTLIKEVVTSGKAVNEAPFRLVGKVTPIKSAAAAQIAFAVPKRNMKLAVDRNRMKRLMREAYRLGKASHLERIGASGVQCAWVLVFQGRAPVTFVETQEKISRALGRWVREHVAPAG